MLHKHATGVIALIGGEQSFLGVMMRSDEKKEKIQSMCALVVDSLGKDNVYGEIVAQRYTDIPFLEDVNTMTSIIADSL